MLPRTAVDVAKVLRLGSAVTWITRPVAFTVTDGMTMNSDRDTETKASRKRFGDLVAWGIWALGAGGIWFLWELQKDIPSPLGDILAYAIFFVAFFYCLAYSFIRNWVSNQMGE